MNERQGKSVPHQELEVLEKYLIESPEHEIQEAAHYIFERVKLNIPKLQNTGEEALAPRFRAVFERVKKYLSAPSPAQVQEYYETRKSQTIELIQTLSPLVVKNSPKYIVSLTSYGKRLADTAPYAITTLINQSVKPDHIVLWVAHEDKENIPKTMDLLVEKGLEIRFCEDIKSYKKLIFALSAFPDDYIITADDDIYYPQNWLEQLLNEHQNNPGKIICHRAHGIKADENHNPLPYLHWHNCINPEEYFANATDGSVKNFPESVFPTGVGGILYPPKSLHPDVLNKELFTKFAPYADDIWFWAMAVINKEYFYDEPPYIIIKNSHCSTNLQTVDPEQMQGKNALWNYNLQGGNDKQLKAVIEHYPQIKEYLQKIESIGCQNPSVKIYESQTSNDSQKVASTNYLIVNKNIYESAQDILISIIVPVFEASQWIERCFLSICGQTYRNSNIECIFVDDCSQDNSAQIIQDLINNYSGEIKFNLILQEKNCGAGECRNAGIRNSSGEYVYFVDADDEINPDSLLILSGLAQKYNDVDMVQGQAETLVFQEGKLIKKDYCDAFFEKYNFPEYTNDITWIRKRMSFTNKIEYIPVTPWNILIRKRFIIENNLYFSNIRSGQDLLWHFFASKYIKNIAFTANVTYLYHREHISVIAKNQRTPFIRILVVEEILKNINVETFYETLEMVEVELNTWVIPYMNSQGPEYYDLRERVLNIRSKIGNVLAEMPHYMPFKRISVIEEMLKNVTPETTKRALVELSTWIIPYMNGHGPGYYDLRKRVRNIEESISKSLDKSRRIISETKDEFNSEKYWEQRYAKAGNSGSGSYGRLAEFKAKVVNEFVLKHDINSVIEFGHGDGNQLSLANYPHYLGFDVSETAVKICKDKFANDKSKDFHLTSEYNGVKAELVLSLDVIYHLIEDIVFEDYMKRLFEASTKFVIVYSSNIIAEQHAAHVKHRKFTDWVEKNYPGWTLFQVIPNRYPANNSIGNENTSFADFYVFVNDDIFNNSLVSILVPVYNTEEYLRQCLDSIVNQTYANIEIICVNDASTDNSLLILNEYARKDNRIVVINKDKNEGLPQARFSAFSKSKGKYIIPIDSDDFIEHDMIKKLYYCAILGDYDMVCCGYFEEKNGTSSIVTPQLLPEDKVARIKFGIFGFGNTKVVWNKLVKKEIFENVKFGNESNGEDCFITCQNLYYSGGIGYYPQPLYHWRYQDKSLTVNKSLAMQRYLDRKANYEHIINFCKDKFGADLNIFEPELSRRMADIESQNPINKTNEPIRIKTLVNNKNINHLSCCRNIQVKMFDLPNVMEITRDGYKFPIYIRNNTSDVRVYKTVIEDEEYNFVTLQEPKTIVDAGGNIGLTAVYFAEKYPDATIITIEPEEYNFKILKENTKKYTNIIALNYALWDKIGEIELLDTGLGNWGFMTGDGSNYDKITTPIIQNKHAIKTVTIENLLKEYNIEIIDILKVDIEGAEKEVFENNFAWIKNVRSIIAELHERMKSGCNKSFEKIVIEFDEIAVCREDIYLSKGGFIRME